MNRFLAGSIFRSSFLLAFGGAIVLAIASIGVISTTNVPFDFPVSTLDVARALKGEPHVEEGSPLIIRDVDNFNPAPPPTDRDTKVLAAIIARQASVPEDAVRLAFNKNISGFAERQFDVARRKYEEHLLVAAKVYEGDPRFSPLIFGSFTAAMRLPNGKWRVADRAPKEPDWQINVAKGILISLLMMVPLTWWFGRRLAAPISALGKSADRIGGGSYEEVKVAGPKEVRQAATAMNQMQARIRAQINERAEMLAAIAHDLRTPLARLSFLLAEQPISNRDQVEDEIAEMDQMIGTTMDYVRSETVEPTREKIELRSMLESIVDDFVDIGKAAMLHSGPSITIFADPVMLRRVLNNVIGNAVSHGHKARVKLFEDGDNALIEVRDEGPGMSEDDIARAFEPFFRAERSRNRNTGGMGLGLAVAMRMEEQ
jgi:two-component system, OmpR family, sensor kinase